MKNSPRLRRLFVLLFLPLAVGRADPIDDYVRGEMQRQNIPGLALAVVRDGIVIKAEGYGLADIENNVAVRPDTAFKIGSVSKQFLASGIMMLVQDGKLTVDDKVSHYLDGTPDTWKNITIRNFLTHTSGVVREGPAFLPHKIQPDIEVIKSAYTVPLLFATGEKYEYCNTGYFSLAEIIARTSGKTWDQFLQDRIFQPLGMNATRLTSVTDMIPNRARGYELEGHAYKNEPDYLALRPSGAYFSTVLDLARWDAALYTENYLTKATREQMWAPFRLNSGELSIYGFGWRVETVNGRREASHGGTLTGFKAHFVRYVDDGLAVIILTNIAHATPEPIAREVAALYIAGQSPAVAH